MMKTKTDYTIMLLNVVSWMIFIGLCIDSGGFITNTIYTLFFNPNAANRFWSDLNFSELYNYNQSHFVTVTALMIIVSVLKSIMFYLIVNIFHQKKFNLLNPFNESFGKYIVNISYLVLAIGLFAYWGAKFTNWLMLQGVSMPSLQNLKFDGADVWLFMGVTLLIVAKIFKRGIELQTENDLTV